LTVIFRTKLFFSECYGVFTKKVVVGDLSAFFTKEMHTKDVIGFDLRKSWFKKVRKVDSQSGVRVGAYSS